MISMTGYAQRDFKINNITFSVIIKSLNSQRGLDLSIKLPRYLALLEPEIKNQISKYLIRGKVDVKLFEMYNESQLNVNEDKLSRYVKILKKVSPKSLESELVKTAVTLPDIFHSTSIKITQKIKKEFYKNINTVISDLVKYRELEGNKLVKAIRIYIRIILKKVELLENLENRRNKLKKDKLLKKLASLSNHISYDRKRFEEEMIYYFEKYDITEERVRLNTHCNLFSDIIKSQKKCGRKLIFLSQEMLREANTIGSKANDVNIQKHVIIIKENIEKIKEQLHNIL